MKIRTGRGANDDTTDNYLQWLLVDNYNQVKQAFDEADA